MYLSTKIHAFEKRLQTSSNLMLWGLVVLWYGLICFLSHTPAAAGASTKSMVGGDDTLNAIMRFCAHLGVFGVLGMLIYAALSRRINFQGKHFFQMLLLVFFLAVLDEAHQYYVPGRHARLQDVLTDCAGAALSVALLSRIKRFFE